MDLAKLHGHDVVSVGNCMSCRSCLVKIPLKYHKIKDFVTSTCIPVNQCRAESILNIPTPAHLHQSHQMSILKGLRYCRRCGAVLGMRIDKLARECEPPTTAGKRNKKHILEGQLPVGVDSWPLDPARLMPIHEDVEELYIQPGLDVFQQPCQSSSIIYTNITQMDTTRQVNEDARRSDTFEAAASSSSQVADCRSSVTSIPRRTMAEVDDDSSSD